MGKMKNWLIDVLRPLSNDLQLLGSSIPAFLLAATNSIAMPVKTKIFKLRKKPAAILKKPASQSGYPGDAGGWESFQIVPFSERGHNANEDKTFSHLKLHGELKKAPAVVKHIQNGTLHTSVGCQSVKDFLRSLDKRGDGSWLLAWESSSQSEKKAIIERLKLQLDEKSVLTIRQSSKAGTRTEHKQVRGWMSLWEVADVEKIPFDPKYTSLLQDCVADDESRVHSNPTLAKKGWREYYHVKKKATVETLYHDESHQADAEVEPQDVDDFEEGRKAITLAGLGKSSSSTTSSPRTAGATSKSSKWKLKADDVIKQLSDAEVEAMGLQSDITTSIDSKSNPALQKKHAALAGAWAKKLAVKKAFVMKNKTLASTSREDIFDKDGNKFDECLTQAMALKDDWEGDNNKALLSKLMNF